MSGDPVEFDALRLMRVGARCDSGGEALEVLPDLVGALHYWHSVASKARRENAALRETIEARDDALMRAGRDNLRLGSTIDHVRFVAQGLDASCTDEVLAALTGAPDPRRVETAEELDALPVGTVIVDAEDDVSRKGFPGSPKKWRTLPHLACGHRDAGWLPLPATVLRTPSSEEFR
ncbi:hypothetical protein [Tsukamurella tyrosinosolvens]|uniref:hypothetical protein n=1 Tax=Tsukamurella tyrosinosolvens TaxID=57704 RepID=UPI002DD42DDF|nr:hypothetical protein [Tsukamurella tyrosinosolvens]MEC4616273.1 hypothetical protein [Tsukamurella tyrosinosolvens]